MGEQAKRNCDDGVSRVPCQQNTRSSREKSHVRWPIAAQKPQLQLPTAGVRTPSEMNEQKPSNRNIHTLILFLLRCTRVRADNIDPPCSRDVYGCSLAFEPSRSGRLTPSGKSCGGADGRGVLCMCRGGIGPVAPATVGLLDSHSGLGYRSAW